MVVVCNLDFAITFCSEKVQESCVDISWKCLDIQSSNLLQYTKLDNADRLTARDPRLYGEFYLDETIAEKEHKIHIDSEANDSSSTLYSISSKRPTNAKSH